MNLMFPVQTSSVMFHTKSLMTKELNQQEYAQKQNKSYTDISSDNGNLTDMSYASITIIRIYS